MNSKAKDEKKASASIRKQERQEHTNKMPKGSSVGGEMATQSDIAGEEIVVGEEIVQRGAFPLASDSSCMR